MDSSKRISIDALEENEKLKYRITYSDMSKSRSRITFLAIFEPAHTFDPAKLNALPFSSKSRMLKRQEDLNKRLVSSPHAKELVWFPEHSCLRSPPPKILVRVSTWPWDES